jgi:hypothetical protein
LGYVIAAYVVVIGSLVVYGVWLQTQRRALMRAEQTPSEGESPGAPGLTATPASTDTAD